MNFIVVVGLMSTKFKATLTIKRLNILYQVNVIVILGGTTCECALLAFCKCVTNSRDKL